MVRRPCDHPECIACRAGRQDFCVTGDYRERGIKSMHGFLTEMSRRRSALYESRAALNSRCRRAGGTADDRGKGLIQALQIQKRLPWGAAGLASGCRARCGSRRSAGCDGAAPRWLRGDGLFPQPRTQSAAPISSRPSAADTFHRRTKRSSKWRPRWETSMWFTKRPVLRSSPSKCCLRSARTACLMLTGVPGRHGPQPSIRYGHAQARAEESVRAGRR